MTEPLIKLKDISKTYQLGKIKLEVLKGINLEISAGSFIVIMGASGSGKSTLLNMISLLDTPTRGDLFWKGRNVSNFSEDEMAQFRGQKIGFVFQQFNLLQNLNALENVMLPMVFQKISGQEREDRAKNLLTLIGLKERIFHRPPELSGGEQQRVVIARALANNPEIIVADEPTGNVDSKTGKIIMEILTKLHQEGKTIIVITHDLNIASYGKKIINIKDGEIIDQKSKIKTNN